MKYALRFDPAETSVLDTPMWVWWQDHGTYFCERQEMYYPEGPPDPRTHRPHYLVKQAKPGFLNSMLDPGHTGTITRVTFDDLPAEVRGYDPREILADPQFIDDGDADPTDQTALGGGADDAE